MVRSAKDGKHLDDLVQLAIPLCIAAQAKIACRGPGRPPDYEEWQIAVLIVIAIVHKQKSKSSQWRFLNKRQEQLVAVLKLKRFPCRDTYCRRHCNVHRLMDIAIELQGKVALKEHVADARVVAVDKSLVEARGPRPRRCKMRRGTDPEAGWGVSDHDGFLWSYSYEAVVTAPQKGVVFPILASVDVGSKSEHRSFVQKIPRLAASVRDTLLDRGYDGNASAEALEYRANGKASGRRYVCPPLARAGKPAAGKCVHRGRRERLRLHRQKRIRFFASKKGRSLYRRRRQTIEPFNAHLKKLFELEDRVWHRGLDNNRTMILASIFSYQLLLRYAFKRGQRNRQLQWILDGL